MCHPCRTFKAVLRFLWMVNMAEPCDRSNLASEASRQALLNLIAQIPEHLLPVIWEALPDLIHAESRRFDDEQFSRAFIPLEDHPAVVLKGSPLEPVAAEPFELTPE